MCAVAGGAGEGKQHLTPTGALKNIHQVKSDEALPFYCHPPNPCPKGYTSMTLMSSIYLILVVIATHSAVRHRLISFCIVSMKMKLPILGCLEIHAVDLS